MLHAVGRQRGLNGSENCHGHGNILMAHMTNAELLIPLWRARFGQAKTNAQRDTCLVFAPVSDLAGNTWRSGDRRNSSDLFEA